jgi:hypothetical protein
MSPPRLFPEPPRIGFRVEQSRCEACGAPLKALKTRTRKAVTLHLGAFLAHESVAACRECGRTHVSLELRRLLPPSSNFGYDVVVHVGKALFLRHRNGAETVAELAAKNVPISQSEVHVLGRKFIVMLARAHRRCAGRIRESMARNGGYVLHLDGTCEGAGPVLMTGLDSITDIVLGNIRLPSEKAEAIVPFLENMKERFGPPAALVHDMGRGILAAVQAVFKGVPDFICHFHFLRDLGNDFLGPEYDIVRKRLRSHGLSAKLRRHAQCLKETVDEHPEATDALRGAMQGDRIARASLGQIPALGAYTLVQWALDAKNQGGGYGFPFDRPHLDFAKRLLAAAGHLERLADIELRGDWRDNRPYYKILPHLRKLADDRKLRSAIAGLEEKTVLFDQLRDAMRIAPADGGNGLNDDADGESMQRIEERVRRFREEELRAHPKCATDDAYKAFAAQLEKYWEKLFADPIEVQTPDGKVTIQPQRTNNILERFFRNFKRGHRRRTGTQRIGRTLRTMLAETPIVKNLDNPEYMAILLGGQASLEALFAQMDAAEIREEIKAASKNPEKIPPVLKAMIQEQNYPETLEKLVAAAARTKI